MDTIKYKDFSLASFSIKYSLKMTKPMSLKTNKTHVIKTEKKTKSGGIKKINDPSKLKNALSDFGIGSSATTTISTNKATHNKLPSFHAEIAGMMYAFGDCRKPNQESVTLVEEIVHQQMHAVLVQITEVTIIRGGKFTSIDDILFLMKNNKYKLRLVIRYLRLKDLKSKTIKTSSPDEDDMLDVIVGDSNKSDSGKRLKLAYDFISSIDGTGELIALFDGDDTMDEIKYARVKRAERMSRCLDQQGYVEYSEARQMSFSKKIGKFKEWLGIGTTIDIKSSAVIEILSYLAYETVHEIVDLSLLVKADQERTDVVSSNIPVSINPLSELAKNSISKQPQIPKGALPTPTHSPPGTPTPNPQNNASTTNNIRPLTSGSSSSLRAPIQGGLASSLGTASLASSLSGLVKQPKGKKKKIKNSSNMVADINSSKIQPAHIREAIRRYSMTKAPLMLSSGFSRATLSQRTLCL